MRGLFHVSQVTAGRKNRLTIEIAGSEGSAAWDSESPNQLWLGSRNRPNQVLERDPALVSAAAGSITHYPGGHAEGFPDTFKQLYLDIYRWIKAGRQAGSPPEFPGFADGDREVRLCEAIGRSAIDGKWIEISDPTPHQEPAGKPLYMLWRKIIMKLGFVSAILPDYSLEGW